MRSGKLESHKEATKGSTYPKFRIPGERFQDRPGTRPGTHFGSVIKRPTAFVKVLRTLIAMMVRKTRTGIPRKNCVYRIRKLMMCGCKEPFRTILSRVFNREIPVIRYG